MLRITLLGFTSLCLILMSFNAAKAEGLLNQLASLGNTPLTPRFGIQHSTEPNGVDDSFTDFRAFVPTGDPDQFVFLDSRLILNTSNQIGYNLGAGFRQAFGADAMFGFNAFVDRRETNFTDFHQIGIGSELFFGNYQFHHNSYFNVGTDEKIVAATEPMDVLVGDIEFSGNQLVSDQIVGFQQLILQRSLQGHDLEFGRTFTSESSDSQLSLGTFVGGYYFENPGLEDAPGVSGRLNLTHKAGIDADLFIQHDRLFETQVGFGIAIYSDILSHQSGGKYEQRYAPVKRRSLMPIVNHRSTAGAYTPEMTLTNADNGGQPFNIIHISSDPVVIDGGAPQGTYENPQTNLGDIAMFSGPNDIIYVHADSTFNMLGTLVLQSGQRLLGEGVPHLVNTVEAGTIALPGSGNGGTMRPLISNSSSHGVQVVSNSEISGFRIDGAGGNGIHNIGDVTGVSISNNLITNSMFSGILMQNVFSGDILNNVTRMNNGPAGIAIREFAGGTVDGNLSENNMFHGIFLDVLAGGTFSNNVSNNNGLNGYFFNTQSSGSAFNNTGSGNGANNDYPDFP